jgi:hypothetical protein
MHADDSMHARSAPLSCSRCPFLNQWIDLVAMLLAGRRKWRKLFFGSVCLYASVTVSHASLCAWINGLTPCANLSLVRMHNALINQWTNE